MTPTCRDRGEPGRTAGRRGVAVYILVLGIATILAMTGITLVTVARSNHRLHASLQKSLQAQYVAQAGLERAFYSMDADATWRQTMPHGAWFSDQIFGLGKYTVTAADTDGNLADDERDTLTLTSTGTVGDAVHKVKVTLTPRPHPALAFAVFGADSLKLRTRSVARGPIRSNGSMSGDSDVDAENNAFFETVQGASIDSDLTPARYAATAMSYPQPSLSYYLALATPITGITGATAKLSKYVLTPTCNSESSSQVNANGIYSLNCLNKDVVIEKTRLKGTLILYNTTKKVTIQHQVLLEPTGYSFPLILMFTSGGDVEFNLDGSALSELSDWMDYNEDGDVWDSLSSAVKGLIWTDHSALKTKKSSAAVAGCFIAGNVEASESIVLDDDPQLAQAMIPGFIDTNMKVIPGSWREVEP